MTKLLVLLCGCGKNDGSEIHESVLALLAIDLAGARYEICAPDDLQKDVVNHQTDEVMEESRNMRVEAARIARGPVLDVKEVNVGDYDALVMPGGFGAAKNLCNFAEAGADCEVREDVRQLINDFHEAGKVIGAICIAPALLAKVLGKGRMTIGNDAGTAAAINQTGSCHVDCAVGDIVVDEELNLVSTPAYMLGQSIKEVHEGIGKLVVKVIERATGQTQSAPSQN
jgi:enhancing lycopene biosynthesis protein 2